MKIYLSPNSIEDYRTFLAVKQLPTYSMLGRVVEFPDEYADRLGVAAKQPASIKCGPHPQSFDYQSAITRMAVDKQKFSVFADCGLGKTLIFLDFVKHAATYVPDNRRAVLIVSPLMVVEQTMAEAHRFYGGDLPIEQVHAKDLSGWLSSSESRLGITNYEALRPDVKQGRLGALILDESSMLKSHYGKWGTKCLELGAGLDWKMACTGTPAPNDRIEYANHAVFMDAFPTVNSFLARYFVNRGQTQERWVLKPHAIGPFYSSLSHWCIFLTNPSTYGWADNSDTIPPMHVHIHDVDMTQEQVARTHVTTGSLFAHKIGGIANRAALASIGKGWHKGESIATNKYTYMRELVNGWPDESTLIWCLYNREQDQLESAFPEAGSIRGETPHGTRMELIRQFKSGERKVLISKPRILGFGLNLQMATRQVFSGLQDSYESFYQAVKRSNRYGATKPLNVHIPVTDIERPMIETVLRKATMVQQDTETQERIFKQCATC